MIPPPGGFDGLRFAGVEDADANRRIGIKQTGGEEFVIAIVDDREFAKLAGAVLFLDAVGVEPGMAGTDDGFRRRADAQPETRWRRGGGRWRPVHGHAAL